MPARAATVVKVTGWLVAEQLDARLLDPSQRLGRRHPADSHFGQEGVEAGDEAPVTIGFIDPAARLGVGGQCFGVDPLSREHRDAGGVGAEVGAVLADVGVGTRTLGGSTQAVAAGEAGLDGRCVTPVAVTGARGCECVQSGQWSDAGPWPSPVPVRIRRAPWCRRAGRSAGSSPPRRGRGGP